MHKKGQARVGRARGLGGSPLRRRLWILTTGLACCTLPACGGGGAGGAASANTGGPELSVESLSFSPSQANAGETIHVVDIVRNDGGAPASGFQVAIYLSTDALVDSLDTLIGLRTVGSLSPGSSSTGGGFLTVPIDQTEGEWYVGCIVDSGGNVVEGNEVDNAQVALQQLTVSNIPAPDLLPTQITFDLTTVEAGQPIGISDRAENHGEGAAGSFQVGIYLSEDETITSSDVLLGLRSVASLAPGEISFLSDSLTVPANTAAGDWFVGSMADVGGTQSESDEFNNTLIANDPLVVTQPPRPDLRMSSLEFSPSALDAGQSVLISESVLNQGLIAAGPFRVGIYLSQDAEITDSDELIGFRSVGGLNVGEQSAVAAPVVVPASIGAGSFHVGAIADNEQTLIESDENNNSILALGTLEVFVPPLPDLRTVAVAFSPNVAESGDLISVVERVTNSGTAAAGAFRVGTYISSNPSVTTSDILLGSRVVSSLAVGSDDEALSQYPVPPGIGSGSWTVGVIVDDLFVVPEPDEGNNLLVASGLLDITGSPDPLPDLVLELLTAGPAQVLTDGQLIVQSVIRNQGDLSANAFIVRFYLSVDENIDAFDYLVGTRTIGGLGIGGGSAQSFPYTLNGSLPLGMYSFGAIIDPDNVVTESDDDNNELVLVDEIEVYIPPPPAPDLAVTVLSTDVTTVVLGGSVLFSHTVRNNGDLDAGAHHVDYYFSDDSVVTADDLWLGSSLSTPSLAPGEEVLAATQIDLPPEAGLGIWHIGAIVITESGPADSNPGNDVFAGNSTVEVTP